jgi:hypothetical protein
MARNTVEAIIIKASNRREFMHRSIKSTVLQEVRTRGGCKFLTKILVEILTQMANISVSSENTNVSNIKVNVNDKLVPVIN